MPKPTRKKSANRAKPGPPSPRKEGTRVGVRNSGLEVWLYDDSNRARIREPKPDDAGFGGVPPDFNNRARDGLIVGYRLQQDDDLDVEVHVGPPFTENELSVARWLEAQHALLRLPSGTLCIESNDANRIGPEPGVEEGGIVNVPPGEYRLTLYRIDREAMFRDGVLWTGAQEVIVLTPGGSAADAADALLPYQDRRDASWVGKYSVSGPRADALAWFGDGWDTFTLNLDSGAISQLSLAPGSFLRTHVPASGLTLYSTFAESWDAASRFAPPAGNEAQEFGYAALLKMAEWDGAEAMFCRRETSNVRIAAQHMYVWMPVVVEVIGARPATLPERTFTTSQLSSKQFFDAEFLSVVLSEVLPEVADLDALPLASALDRLDKKLGKMGLTPQGDATWHELVKMRREEASCRFYAGLSSAFAAIIAGAGKFELIFISERDDGGWFVTGLADEMERRINRPGPNGLPAPHPRVQFHNIDESLSKIFTAHKRATGQVGLRSAPQSFDDCLRVFARFLAIAFDQAA